MRFKPRGSAKSPEINLIPLIDVLMTVLMFFIMVTMILGEERRLGLTLPNADDAKGQSRPASPIAPLIVQLDDRGDLFIKGKTVAEPQMMQAMETYLGEQPKGAVFLLPHPDLPYEQVIQILGKMQELGGDRVSLALGAN
jgi:biopolymer transport protein ExbD